MKTKFILFCLLFVGFSTVATAQQNYSSAVGARFGYPLSASYKKFISEPGAIEAYVGLRGNTAWTWVSISAAYLHHKELEIENISGLNWYFGGGGSVYFWNYKFSTDIASTTLGLQGYIGLEYTFDDLPLTVTLDWVPTIFLNSYVDSFGGGYGGLGVRYILNR